MLVVNALLGDVCFPSFTFKAKRRTGERAVIAEKVRIYIYSVLLSQLNWTGREKGKSKKIG